MEEIEQLLVEEFPTTVARLAANQRRFLFRSKLPYGNFLSILCFFKDAQLPITKWQGNLGSETLKEKQIIFGPKEF